MRIAAGHASLRKHWLEMSSLDEHVTGCHGVILSVLVVPRNGEFPSYKLTTPAPTPCQAGGPGEPLQHGFHAGGPRGAAAGGGALRAGCGAGGARDRGGRHAARAAAGGVCCATGRGRGGRGAAAGVRGGDVAPAGGAAADQGGRHGKGGEGQSGVQAQTSRPVCMQCLDPAWAALRVLGAERSCLHHFAQDEKAHVDVEARQLVEYAARLQVGHGLSRWWQSPTLAFLPPFALSPLSRLWLPSPPQPLTGFLPRSPMCQPLPGPVPGAGRPGRGGRVAAPAAGGGAGGPCRRPGGAAGGTGAAGGAEADAGRHQEGEGCLVQQCHARCGTLRWAGPCPAQVWRSGQRT